MTQSLAASLSSTVDLQVTPYAAAALVAGLFAVGFALALRRREGPGVDALAVLSLFAAWWSVTYALDLAAVDVAWKVAFSRLSYLGITGIPVAWAVFALQYSGHGDLVTRRYLAAVSAFPATVLVVVWSGDGAGLIWASVGVTPITPTASALTYTYGALFWPWTVYVYLLFAVGTVLVIRTVLGSNAVYHTQAALLLAGAVVPWAGNAVYVGGFGPPGLDLTPFAFVVSVALLGVAMSRYHFGVVSPGMRSVGRDALVERMDAGVVVLSGNDRVVDLNRRAATLLDTTTGAAVGRELSALDPALAEAVGGDIERDGRTYAVRGTPIGDVDRPDEGESTGPDEGESTGPDERAGPGAGGESDRGRILTLTDVTAARRREEHLTVLNRVLRHDLRNDVSVLSGYATLLREEPENPAYADVIAETADAMADRIDSVETVERAIEDRRSTVAPRDLVPTVRRAVTTLRDTRLDARLAADLPADAWVLATELLPSVVDNLVENAVEHSDRPRPRVEVTVRRRGRWDDRYTDLVVADDGPGIHGEDRKVLVGDPDADPAAASGLGLWLIQQIVSDAGGRVDYRENDPRGSVVTVSLRSADHEGGRDGDHESSLPGPERRDEPSSDRSSRADVTG